MICPYCNNPAEKATGAEVYPHRPDLFQKKFWVCKPCDARVGCHKDTYSPLGRLANAELRKAKMLAHAVFDPLWKDGEMSRNAAYRWLAEQLGIKVKNCHIGGFDLDQCREVVRICRERTDAQGTV